MVEKFVGVLGHGARHADTVVAECVATLVATLAVAARAGCALLSFRDVL